MTAAQPGYAIGLAHAQRGRAVFPFKLVAKSGGKYDKRPLPEHGHLDATTDETTIIGWARKWPDAMYGWALPIGTVLADVDDREAFAATGLVLPPAPSQTTIRGGEHRLYAAANADQTVAKIPGLDTRVGGKGWAALYSADAFQGDPPPAPAWLVKTSGRTNGHAPFIEVKGPSPAREAIASGRLFISKNSRDDTLASIAGTLIADFDKGGIAAAVTTALGLLDAAGAIEQPTGDEIRDFDRIAHSVARKAGAPERLAEALAALSWAQLMAEPSTPPPMIRPGVPEVGVTVQAGSPKAGKTLWASQVALESRRPTLLVVEEGSRTGLSYRMRLQAAELGIEDPPITLMHRQRIRLDDRRSVASLRAYLAETRPALVVMDPLNRLHSADENKPSQMTPVMDALAELAYEDGGRAVIAIHHVNKPSADRRGDIWDRMRGASSIRSGTDANLILDGDRGTYRKLVGEFRDAEPLIEHLELDRAALLFRPSEAPIVPSKVDPMGLRLFVEERGQVTAAEVAERFSVTKNTAITALRALGCDEYEGLRKRLTFTLATA